MKTGRSISELAQEIERQTQSKRDFIAPGKSLSVITNEGLKLSMAGQAEMEMTDNFHDQMATTLSIPKAYYERLRREAPELLAENVNHWLPDQGKRMIRTLDGKARAFLSDRYRPLDHFELMEAVLPSIMQADCRIESCEVTENRLYLKAVSNRLEGEVKVGDVVQAGLMVSNSEVGTGSLSVQPLIYRLVCKNGAIVSDLSVRKTHVGRNGFGELHQAIPFFRDDTKRANDKAFFLQLRDTVASILSEERFLPLVTKMRTTFDNYLPPENIEPVLEEVTRRYSLLDGERKSVMAHLIQGGDLSQYGLMNAVTRAAQDVEQYDRATELESVGGDILELTNGDWKRLAQFNRN